MKSEFELRKDLKRLGLSRDEAAVFTCLVNSPKTPLNVSRATGIGRSNVYRIVDGLIAKGMAYELTTDNDKMLAAAKPEALELLVIEHERIAFEQRYNFNSLLTHLAALRGHDDRFSIRTYTGQSGIRQMLWNELESKNEILVFSGGSLEPAIGRNWAEKYRAEIVRRGIKQRGIENETIDLSRISNYGEYHKHYVYKCLPKTLLAIPVEITVHDDIVSFYNSRTNDAQLGTEIKNPLLAAFMNQVFEHYWQLATEPNAFQQQSTPE